MQKAKRQSGTTRKESTETVDRARPATDLPPRGVGLYERRKRSMETINRARPVMGLPPWGAEKTALRGSTSTPGTKGGGRPLTGTEGMQSLRTVQQAKRATSMPPRGA